MADFNGDGKLDVVVTSLGAPAELWLNRSGAGNHWIEFKIAEIGATVSVDGQWNTVASSQGYASSSAVPLHFGLGASMTAKRVEIRFPDGRSGVLNNLAADQIHRIGRGDILHPKSR